MIFIFTSKPDGTPIEQGNAKTSTEFEAHYLTDVVANFEDFLRGCGFGFDGHLDFVENEE